MEEPTVLFERVPFIRLVTRSEVDAFLGFRHVTGIKEWAPPEKAQFIAKLIDDRRLSYRDVMRMIGSTTPVVERNYVAYCILLQMENVEGLEVAQVEDRFSVLFLALRTNNVRDFLGVSGKFGIDPEHVKPPVDNEHIQHLKEFSLWLFGDSETPPIVKDSREIDRFSTVLASSDAVEYLRAMRKPSLEKAYVIAGGDQEEVYNLVSTAAYCLQEALSSLHLYKDDEGLVKAAKRLLANSEQIRKTLEI